MSTYLNAGVDRENFMASFKGVYILGEQRNGQILPVTYELIARGRSLADDLNAKLTCVLLGETVENPEQAITQGADRVVFIKDASLAHFLPRPYTNAICKLVEEERPEIIIAAATTTGRTVMPLVAAKLHTGLTADCTSLTIDQCCAFCAGRFASCQRSAAAAQTFFRQRAFAVKSFIL